MSEKVYSYLVKSATDVAKLALEYRKIQEISKLTSKVEQHTRVTESLKSFCNLIRNDVQSIMHMYFESAYNNFNYALTAEGEIRADYLRQAKNRFIDALSIEKNENLILSYIGLAICQMATNDEINSAITLSKIKFVCCELSDDYNVLSKDAPYFEEWQRFKMFFLMRCITRERVTFESTWSYLYPFEKTGWNGYNEHLTNMKNYFRRYVEAYKTLGGFTLDEELHIHRETKVFKTIIEEDFYTFKKEVITQFNI